MINITKAILHTMDSKTERYYNAQEEMILDIPLREYMMKHIEKAMAQNNAEKGIFKLTSKLYERIKEYDSNQFVELTKYISNKWFGIYMDNLRYVDMNLLCVEFTKEDESYFGVMQFKNKSGYMRNIAMEDGIVHNEIITQASLLPSLSQNIEEFFFINLYDFHILMKENKRFFGGEEELLLSDQILYCDIEMSMKESLETLDTIVVQVSNELEDDALDNTLKVKRLLKSCVETDQQLDIDMIGPVAFPDKEEFQKKLETRMMEVKMPKTINLKAKTPPGIRKHKIKTDAGIEISIPVEYTENKDTFEIIENSDGTVSIHLNHVGKMIGR